MSKKPNNKLESQSMITSFFQKKLDKSSTRSRKRPRIEVEVDNDWRNICISGINLEFPISFDPYPSQSLIMEANISSFNKSNNVLIESPTGSGKTMALLSSAIGWLRNYKRNISASHENCLKHGNNKCNEEESIKKTEEKDIKIENNKCNINECFDNNDNISILCDKDNENKSNECTCINEIKIYYATRTHKQIAQVIKELKRLPYCYNNSNNTATINHTILSSKEHTCINSVVKKSSNITEKCKEIDFENSTKCKYKMRLIKTFDKSMRKMMGTQISPAWDIEELVEYGERYRVCPHFAASTFLRMDANIIFCPFNYIIDPIIRDTANIELKDSIIILDEAHNIESFCRSSSSFDFTEKEIIHSLNDIYLRRNLLDKFLKENTNLKLEKEVDDTEDAYLSEYKVTFLNENLQHLNYLLQFLKSFLNWFNNFAVEVKNVPSKNNIQSRVFRTSEIMRSLVTSKLIEYKNNPLELQRLKNAWIGAMKVGGEDENEFDISDTKLNKKFKKIQINSLTIVCIEKFIYFIQFLMKSPNAYRLFYSIEESNVSLDIFNFKNTEISKFSDSSIIYKSNNELLNIENEKTNYDNFIGGEKYVPIKENCIVKMELWCLDPSLCFVDAFNDAHSVVLASGTLSPINTFVSELGMKFESIVQGDQIVPKEQIFASVISVGPKDNDIICTRNELSSCEGRNGVNMLLEIASLIVDICENVSKGILVFFPSYSMLQQVMTKLYQSGLIKKLKRIKEVLQEPRKTSELDSIMESYKKAIKCPNLISQYCTGAVMFAVFRGKFSEGIDFTDDLARCVISIGIPFPNIGDPQVKEKKDFNDKFHGQKNLLPGEEWYKIEAYRALNQALGRCIRHRNDWGLIVMVDKRLYNIIETNSPDKNKISKWVVENIRLFNKYEKFKNQMKQFVSEREKLSVPLENIII
uniref:DNA 5'-3' helicase n=1 Tax=Strongyloides stercoralis TaxID=6248 RepID=A0A0K0EHR3_STRER